MSGPERVPQRGEGASALRAFLVLAALVAIWAPDALLGVGTYWHHDLRTHHYPWRAWAAASWLRGELPLWCAGAANGYPLLADGQAGVLYPPTMLLFALLPDPLAMAWTVLLHQLWAGFCTWLLARALGRSPAAALLAAVAWAFGGFFVTHTLYLGMQNALAWLPFTLWALVQATRAGIPGRRWWVAVGAGLALMALAGHVQAAAFSWLLVGLCLLWRLAPGWQAPRGLLRPATGFAAAALGALALASPQLCASFELSRFSMRQGGVAEAFAGIGSLPPPELINGVLPRFFGFERPADIPLAYEHRGLGYWGMGENHWEMAFYLGIPVVFLALWTLWCRRERFWWGLVLAAVLLMLGRFAPAWGLFRLLPGMGWFRFPVRFAIWLCMALPLLAASGLDDLLEAVEGPRWPAVQRWLYALGGLVLLGLLGAGALQVTLRLAEPRIEAALTAHYLADTRLPEAPDPGPLLRAAMPAAEPEDPARVPAKVQRVLGGLREGSSRQLLWPLTQLAVLAGGLVLLRRRRLSDEAVAAGALLLLFADLAWFGIAYHPRVPAALPGATPAALPLLDPDRDRYRATVVDRRADTALDGELMSASLGLLWGLQDVIVTSPLLIVRNEALLGLCGLDLAGERGQAKVRALQERLPIASLLGVRYLLSAARIEDPRLEPIASGSVRLYRNLAAQPLATLVGCVHPAAGPDEAFAALTALRPGQEAVVELAAGQVLPPALTRCEAAGPVGSVEVLEHAGRTWHLSAAPAVPALLVLAETWYPGWRAWVDGAEVPIHLADLALRGIEVPPGAHEIRLAYEPGWLRPCLAAAGLALFAGLLALAWPRRLRI